MVLLKALYNKLVSHVDGIKMGNLTTAGRTNKSECDTDEQNLDKIIEDAGKKISDVNDLFKENMIIIQKLQMLNMITQCLVTWLVAGLVTKLIMI